MSKPHTSPRLPYTPGDSRPRSPSPRRSNVLPVPQGTHSESPRRHRGAERPKGETDQAEGGAPSASGARSRGRQSPVHARKSCEGSGSDERAGRQRGAQPGNLNALKHGFYSKHMQADELADLAEATVQTLNGEIGLARVAARRVLALLDEAADVQERVALLNAITMAAMRVASLLKTKKYLSGNGDDMGAALQEALKDVALEQEPLK